MNDQKLKPRGPALKGKKSAIQSKEEEIIPELSSEQTANRHASVSQRLTSQ